MWTHAYPNSYMLAALILLLAALGGPKALAEEGIRYYEEAGITFKEVRTKVQQPVREIEYRDEQQTLYRERYVTDMQPTPYTTYQPVTQYYWEPRWHGWWRPLQGPQLAYHLVPRTTWQPHVANYQVPVTRREVIPETRTVKVAVPKLSMQDVEQVSRVAVGPAAAHSTLAQQPTATSPPLAWNLAVPQITPAQPRYVPPYQPYAYYPNGSVTWPYGGVARMYGDPPRYGNGSLPGTNQGNWQARRDSDETSK